MLKSILKFCQPPWKLGQRVTTEVPCCLTGSTDAVVVATRDRHLRPLCTVISVESGLVFVDPRPSTAEVQEFYEKDYRQQYKKTLTPHKRHVYRAGLAAQNRLEVLNQFGKPGMRLLDIGAGGGEFVYLAKQQGFDASGIEPNRGYAEYARNQYQIDIQVGSLQDIQLEPESYDLITMFHVLEHLDSPVTVLQDLVAALKFGGQLLIEVPNVECCKSSPWYKWHVGHLYHYNVPTLEMLGRSLGLHSHSVWASGYGSLVQATFEKVYHPEVVNPEILAGNFEKTLGILQQHTPLSYLTNYSRRIERVKQKINRHWDERQQTIKIENPQQILDETIDNRKAV
ncbi:MAG: hypothetical protein COA78_20855 [Blastopirellula sp.]|nr:MAG: hypothetical protein COA78_20855 [Blastopirellula sp.]